jgi:large repetitive protein
MRYFFILLLNGLIISILGAQGNPTNILMRTDTVRTCFARFTDNGGINGNYSPNLNQTLVLCPPAAQHLDTNKISISFNLIDLAAGDRLCIFDGMGVNAPALGCNSNTDFVNRVARATTTNISGCLTVAFTSNATDERSGWDATVGCDRACQNFMGQIDYSSKPMMQKGRIKFELPFGHGFQTQSTES